VAGADVVGVAVIAARDTGAREKVEAAGLPYRFVYDLTDLGLA
jgi:orotate phosphoribosyltransferase